MLETHAHNSNDRLTMRLLDMIKTEVSKSDTQEKIKCIVNQVLIYLTTIIQPYIVVAIVSITLILLCQGYLVYRTWILQRSLSTK
jgi:hypothetical protein